MTKRRVAPPHLSSATRAWWRDVVQTYDLEPHHERLLTLAGEAWDRAVQARQALNAEGLTYEDVRFKVPRARPEVAIERDSALRFARLLRELNLDDVPPPDAPRWGGRKSE